MELLFVYIPNDRRNIKNCSYNFSSEYIFSYDESTKTFSMEHCEGLPAHWFGNNILNITAIVGKNGTGKTNLLNCIIKSLCGSGGSWVIFRYKDKLYTNVPASWTDIKFTFNIERFSRWGNPLNSEFKEHIDDTFVTYYSSAIDRSLSNHNSHYHNFSDISNSYILRQPINKLTESPDYARMSDVDIMQTNDMFSLLLFFIYSHEQKQTIFDLIKLPDYFELKLLYFSDQEPQHPTFQTLTQRLPEKGFKAKIRRFILTQIFLSRHQIPESWNDKTNFEDIVLFLNRGEDYRANIFNILDHLYDNSNIKYNEPQSTGLRKGYHELNFSIRIGAINQEFLNALYCYYNFMSVPYASFGTMEYNTSNPQVVINLGISSGERALYTLISRLMGVIFMKQGEIHHAAINKINHDNRFNGKTIIILLDEPDMQLHPEWQQKFIRIILNLLHVFFSRINFQIILTTHSPILLSDIPKTNVIFIDKNSDGTSQVCNGVSFKETFAANIHTLYNNGFFLNGVPIGEFAKQKIESIHRRIEIGRIDSDTLNDIYRIGEPIIRNILLQQYDAKRNLLPNEQRKELLKEELNKLENME